LERGLYRSGGERLSSVDKRWRVDPGVAPTYEGDELAIERLGRRNLEVRGGDPLATTASGIG
jgi:hypothetical protein